MMLTIDLKDLTVQAKQKYLQNVIAPRPICFASTISAAGEPNVSPFSFFNLFSSNPPVAVFSPAFSGRTGAPKDTLLNLREVPECVINIVTYNMVHQVSLASSPFPKGTNEFVKAGLTPVPSQLVRPLRVKESPVQLECRVTEIKELGTAGGAGNLVICEILLMHVNEDVLDENNQVDTRKIDLVARMGDNWYCRAHGDALFEVQKPITTIGIGIDALPASVRNSVVLTGNNLGLLASVEKLPAAEVIEEGTRAIPPFAGINEAHLYAQTLLEAGKVTDAWIVLLSFDKHQALHR